MIALVLTRCLPFSTFLGRDVVTETTSAYGTNGHGGDQQDDLECFHWAFVLVRMTTVA